MIVGHFNFDNMPGSEFSIHTRYDERCPLDLIIKSLKEEIFFYSHKGISKIYYLV